MQWLYSYVISHCDAIFFILIQLITLQQVDGFSCKKQVGTPGYIAPEIIQNLPYGTLRCVVLYCVVISCCIYVIVYFESQQQLLNRG